MRILHVIVGLGRGGAERMLFNVLKHRSDEMRGHDVRVLSMGASHHYESLIRDVGVPVLELDLNHHPIRSASLLYRALRGADVISSWMYHANVATRLLSPPWHRKRRVWAIRHSNVSSRVDKRRTVAIIRAGALLSHGIDVIAYNGERAREEHRRVGYRGRSDTVVLNGTDLERFQRHQGSRKSLILELGLLPDAEVALSVGRAHPIKDLPTFIRALQIARESHPGLVGVMCGTGVAADNESLAETIALAGLTPGRDLHLLGERSDLPRLFSAADLYVLHSKGEAFPNTLIEAMACEAPCVTTDVGDAACIVTDAIPVVPPEDPTELASAIVEVLERDPAIRQRQGQENREHVRTHYSITERVSDYERLYCC